MEPDDLILDENQVEEDILQKKLRHAMALQLRRNTNMEDAVGAGMAAFDRGRGMFMEQDIERERKELGRKNSEALANALRDQPDEVKAMVMSPATRKQGLLVMQENRKRKMDQDEMDKLRAGGGGAPESDYALARTMSLSSNPTIAARGKQMLELMKGHDPKNSGRMNPDGTMSAIPGAIELYDRTQKIDYAARNPQGVPVPTGQGGTRMMPADGSGQPPTGGALPGATGLAPPPVAPPTQAPSPASGPSALPGATRAAPRNPEEAAFRAQNPNAVVPPEVQIQRDMQRLQTLEAELNKVQQQVVGGRPTPEQGKIMQALGREMQTTHEQIQMNRDRAGGGALPQATQAAQGPQPTQGMQRYNAGEGATDPIAQDIYKKRAENDDAVRREQMLKAPGGGAVIRQLNELRALNNARGGTFEGGSAEIKLFFDNWLGGSRKGNNTMTLRSAIEESIAPMLKQYGQNPSNIDLTAARRRLPEINQSKEARNQIIDLIERGVAAEMTVRQRTSMVIQQIQQTGQGTIDPERVLQEQWDIYNAEQARKEQAARPPSAGGANSALPGAVSAAGGTPPSSGRPWGAETLGKVGEFAGDVVRNAEEFIPSLISKGGVDAAKDAYSNIWEGAKGLVGMSDRSGVAAEKERQAAKAASDPQYNQASIFHNIFNPTAAAGGSAATIPKIMAAGAAQGLFTPQESWSEQVIEGGKGAAIALPFGIAGKAIPSASVAKTLDVDDAGKKLLAKFPSFKPNAAQANPDTYGSAVARGMGTPEAAALAQTKAITKDLTEKAGIKGGQVSNDIIFNHFKSLRGEYETLFAKGAPVHVDSQTLNGITQLVKNNPGLQQTLSASPRLMQLIEVAAKGSPSKLDASFIHDVWKEIGRTRMTREAAVPLREILEGVIEKNMSPASLTKFRDLNQKWGMTSDIERVWRGGGSAGVGSASGYLNPAKILTEAGTGPYITAMDDAAELIQKFGVRNPTQEAIEPTLEGIKKTVQRGAGRSMNKLDFTDPRLAKSTQWILDALRSAGPRMPGIMMGGPEGEQ